MTMTMTRKPSIVCIRPMFPRSQHRSTCLYILTNSEFISSCSRPAVGSNIVQIHSRNFFCKCFFLKWPLAAILDVQKSLLIAFLTICDRYQHFYFVNFLNKMATGGHFGRPKITFDRISGHFRSIDHFGCQKFTFDRISGHSIFCFDKMAANYRTKSIIELVRDIWMSNACVKFEERSLTPSKVITRTTKL